MGKKIFIFFIYSNLFIAGCAVAMVDQTFRFILQSETNFYFLLFVFFSTLCSYNFHWFLTSHSVIPSPRIKWIEKNRHVHLLFFVTGLIGSCIFFFYLIPYWPWLVITALMTFLYSAPKIPHPLFRSLRKLALGKTIFLALVWMNVTTLLPMIISGQSWRTDFTLFIISRFFLIYSICILFDYRDREDDKADGIRSLITYLNEKQVFNLFLFSLIIFFLSTTLLSVYHDNITSVIVLLIPGFIIASLFNYAKNNFTDIFYYLVLDGLMAFSALVMLIPGI